MGSLYKYTYIRNLVQCAVLAMVITSLSIGSAIATPTIPSKYKGYKLVSTHLSTVPTSNMIYVKYGSHTYGCKTQAEYDAVLGKVQSAIKANINKPLDKYCLAFMAGDKYTNYKEGTEMYKGLLCVLKADGYFIFKVGNVDATRIFKGSNIYASFSILAKDPKNGSPNSAYDVLFRKTKDCDAGEQLISAIFDCLGYSSVIMANDHHASHAVKVKNIWWYMGTPTTITEGKTVYRLTQPSF